MSDKLTRYAITAFMLQELRLIPLCYYRIAIVNSDKVSIL